MNIQTFKSNIQYLSKRNLIKVLTKAKELSAKEMTKEARKSSNEVIEMLEQEIANYR